MEIEEEEEEEEEEKRKRRGGGGGVGGGGGGGGGVGGGGGGGGKGSKTTHSDVPKACNPSFLSPADCKLFNFFMLEPSARFGSEDI